MMTTMANGNYQLADNVLSVDEVSPDSLEAESTERYLLIEFPTGIQLELFGPSSIGILYDSETGRVEAHCIDGDCKLRGDVDGEIILSAGEKNVVSEGKVSENIESADYGSFNSLTVSVDGFVTITPTPLPAADTPGSPTNTPNQSATNTPVPLTAIATPPLNPLDLDLDGVIHDPENGQFDLCQDRPRTHANCGCPVGEVPASSGREGDQPDLTPKLP